MEAKPEKGKKSWRELTNDEQEKYYDQALYLIKRGYLTSVVTSTEAIAKKIYETKR